MAGSSVRSRSAVGSRDGDGCKTRQSVDHPSINASIVKSNGDNIYNIYNLYFLIVLYLLSGIRLLVAIRPTRAARAPAVMTAH
ncbi:hypothetical protein H8A95_03350 [Bradyrhizobium sp. Pear76]|nr:hypothetical protein [Bradyrhizobium oropedii]